MDKKLFDIAYRKFSKKDYFGTRLFILTQWRELKNRGVKVPFWQVKKVLQNEKQKCFNMILNRIEKAKKDGVNVFPTREKFTHYCFKIAKIEA